MLVDVKSVMEQEGAALRFEGKFSLEPDQSESPMVWLRGEITNRNRIVTLAFLASFAMPVTCARCLKEELIPFEENYSHTLVTQLHDASHYEDYIVVESDVIDVAEIAREDILLSLPLVTLCKPDCKGLCPKCGKDLNEGPCSCEGQSPENA